MGLWLMFILSLLSVQGSPVLEKDKASDQTADAELDEIEEGVGGEGAEDTEAENEEGGGGGENAIKYSIRFYHTPEFANETSDVNGFIDMVLAEHNLAYTTVPGLNVRAVSLCSSTQVVVPEDKDSDTAMMLFAGLKPSVAELRGHADLAVLLVSEFPFGLCGVAHHDGLASGQLLAAVRKSCIEPSTATPSKSDVSNLARLVDLLLNPPLAEGELPEAKGPNGLSSISVNPYRRPPETGTAQVDERMQLFQKLAAMGDESADCPENDEAVYSYEEDS